MFFELAQFSKFFLIAPITWMLVCFASAFLVTRKWLRITIFSLSGLLFLIFTNPILAQYSKYRQAAKFENTTMEPEKVYDVAIVMGGFSQVNKDRGNILFIEDRADRLWEAVRLYKQGKVKRILITGDPASIIDDKGNSTAKIFLKYMNDFGVPDDAFILEQKARNTRENAMFTKEILDTLPQNEKDDILLITSGVHMGRALDSFDKIGIKPDYYAVSIPAPPSQLNHRSFYPSWKAAEEWQEILNEHVGSLAYKVTGFN